MKPLLAKPQPEWQPEVEFFLTDDRRGFRISPTTECRPWSDLFSPRQLTALSDLLQILSEEARAKMKTTSAVESWASPTFPNL